MTQPWISGEFEDLPGEKWLPSFILGTESGGVKVWNGSEWQLCPIRVWDGTFWRGGNVKTWTGSTWKEL